MAFRLEALEPADVSRCVDIYFASFQNPHSLACWPRTASVRQWWENMIYDELEDPGSHWLKVVDLSSGHVAGFAKWQQPKPGVEPDTDLPEWPSDADSALCNETFGAWAQCHRELMGRRGHWYLEIVATHPDYQSKGAGSQMMRWGLERADIDGVEAYLEASPDAVPLYERHGFREADRTDTFINNERVMETWYRNMFMIRPAKAKS